MRLTALLARRVCVALAAASLSGCGDPAPAPAGDAVARGRAHYQLYCATCHGAEGRGDGPAAARLHPKPADHTDARAMDALSDAYLFRVIARGGAAVGRSSRMPPFAGTLSDAQIRDVVAYLRNLATPPGPARRARRAGISPRRASRPP